MEKELHKIKKEKKCVTSLECFSPHDGRESAIKKARKLKQAKIVCVMPRQYNYDILRL